MVEGHSVHRIATRFRQKLVGRKFVASSPNGRFAEGSKIINGSRLTRMEAVGKNLFAFFGTKGGDTVVHVHFGMSGIWSLHKLSEEPDVKPTTRLRLEQISDDNLDDKKKALSVSPENSIVAHLSCMTCNFGGPELFATKLASLGMDPLRYDADPDALWTRIKKSKKSIGKLLMDQSFFAGPGNIYRAEILFLAGIHPETLGMCLDRASFDRVWNVSVQLLRRGYDTGSILTVDPMLDPKVARRGIRRYIYNRSSCARCGGVVRSWDISGRTCYACESGCQKQILGANQTQETSSEKNSSVKIEAHTPFISHCAPIRADSRLDDHGPSALTIKEIRLRLETLVGPDSLPPKSAKKSVHVEALTAALAASKSDTEPPRTSSFILPAPTVSAEDAAREKDAAGEHRGVEHVAELSSGQALKAINEKTPASKRRGGKQSLKASKRRNVIGKEKTQAERRTRSRRRLKFE